MPREPANPFGLRWCSLAAGIQAAGLNGGGLMWPFGPWDTCWWPGGCQRRAGAAEATAALGGLMPARGQPPLPPALQPRAAWESAFTAELVRLKPHLAGAHRLLKTHLVAGWRRHGIEVDPKKAAREYCAALG